jgi:hypothetical protein
MKKILILLLIFGHFVGNGQVFSPSGGASGGFTTQSVASTTTLGAWQLNIPVDATSGAVTVTLPSAVINSGKQIIINRTDVTANIVTVAAASGQTIEGNASYVVGNGNRLILQSNGTSDIKILNATVGVAEGFEILNPFTSGSTTASLSYVDAPGTALINIPSAGTWEIGYWANVVNSTVNAGTNMCLSLVSGTPLQGTESVWQTQTTNAAGTVTGQREVVTTGPTTYRVQWKCIFGTSSRIGYTGGINDMSRTWCRKVSNPVGVAGIAGAVQGQMMFSTRITADFGNWILMDGRAKTAFTAAQQAVMTALGIGTNIDDFRGRYIVGANGTFVLATPGGSATLAQNMMPNVILPVSVDVRWSATAGTGGTFQLAAGNVFSGTNTSFIQTANTSSINGGVTQQPLRVSDLPVNVFMWFGPSAQTVTVTQPLTLTTTGTTPTFNIATATIDVPISVNIGDAKSGFQTGDHNGWLLLNGRLKTLLTAQQQANATALGIGANLPNATGRGFTQGTLLANIGSATIIQTDLPNVTLTTVAGGNHNHIQLAANGSATQGVGTGGRNAGEISIIQNTQNTTGTGAHTHTIALNGGVTQTNYTPASIGVNQFIYLGIQ